MKLGAMTNPAREPLAQINWMRQQGFDFVELAVEPPRCDVNDLGADTLRSAAAHAGVDLVVHSSPYLPLASRHREAERAARSALRRTVELAREMGAKVVTVHYAGGAPYLSFSDLQAYYAGLLGELCELAGSGLSVALVNSPHNEREVLLFIEIFRRVPRVRLALDIGHANLHVGVNLTAEFLSEPIVGARLSHVYVSDNDGKHDQHLPLGAIQNGVDWPRMVELLRRNGYDGTITLEILSADKNYLLASRDKFRAWWKDSR